MKKHNLIVGRLGEQTAANFLRKKGYKLIDQNFRTRFGEIDLIMNKKQTLVFIEVKSRVGNYSHPEWQINARKIAKVKKMAQLYILKKRPNYNNLRIDAVCVILDKNKQVVKIKHYQNPIF